LPLRRRQDTHSYATCEKAGHRMPRSPMDTIVKDLTSVEGLQRLEFFRRPDDSYGYRELTRHIDEAEPTWRSVALSASRFDSLETALAEAQSRVKWLRRESNWPARDKESASVVPHAPGYVQCPFCAISFSLGDPDRWGGSRHLTCGQRIHVAA